MGLRKKKKPFSIFPEKKYPNLLSAFIDTDTKLFKEEEGTFTDNNSRKRVFVHLVPAPWSRVIAYSIIYAFAVVIADQIWIAFFGRPQWHLVDTKSVEMAEQLPQKTNYP